MIGARYVSHRFTHRDSRARDSRIFDLLNLIRRGCNFSEMDMAAGVCRSAFRPCNFHHKFRRRFFALDHARFSRPALFVSASSLWRARTYIYFLSGTPWYARKIAEVLRFVSSATQFVAVIYWSVQRINISGTVHFSQFPSCMYFTYVFKHSKRYHFRVSSSIILFETVLRKLYLTEIYFLFNYTYFLHIC